MPVTQRAQASPTSTPASSDIKTLQNFQKNLKTTDLGVRFFQKLFTDPTSLSAAQIVEVFKTLGFKVPDGTVMTAEVAQLMCSGQVAISAIEEGNDIQEITKASADSVSTSVQIATQLGWIHDKDGSIAMTISLVSNVGAIIGSCGSDVQAWIGLAMLGYTTDQKNKAMASMLSHKAVFQGVNSYLAPEQKNFAQNFKDLQSGKIGLLGWIAKNAQSAPTLFISQIKDNPDLVKKFPFLAGLQSLPEISLTFSDTETVSQSFLGMGKFNSESSSYSYSMDSLAPIQNADDARTLIFKALIEPYVVGYDFANQYYKGASLAMENVAIMYALGFGGLNIDPNFDYSMGFKLLQLSPYEMEESFIQTSFSVGEKPPPEQLLGQAVSFGTAKAIYQTTQAPEYLNHLSNIILADQVGVPNYLFLFKEVSSLMTRYCTLPLIPNGAIMATARDGNQVVEREKYFWWRDIQNFSIAMEYLDLIRNDPYFFDWETKSLAQYSFIKSMAAFEDKTKNLHNLSLIRRINYMAKSNMSYFFGTTPDKLKNVNTNKTGPAIIRPV